jgi:hypothetical protein
MAMKLRYYYTDMRGGYVSDAKFRDQVIDEETDKEVGFVQATRTPATRHISLFGGKYQGDVKSIEDVVAFLKGVEAVLNHLTEIPESAASQAA